jgi:hypothetical protein
MNAIYVAFDRRSGGAWLAALVAARMPLRELRQRYLMSSWLVMPLSSWFCSADVMPLLRLPACVTNSIHTTLVWNLLGSPERPLTSAAGKPGDQHSTAQISKPFAAAFLFVTVHWPLLHGSGRDPRCRRLASIGCMQHRAGTPPQPSACDVSHQLSSLYDNCWPACFVGCRCSTCK